jgi:hypothetical protein
MSPVSNLWRQLVERRLWPVAILLLAALVAVPLTLAKEPAPEPAPPVAAKAAGDDELAVKPIVAPVSAEERTKRRHVLGSAKNPFRVEKADVETTGSDVPTDTSTVSPATGDGGSDAATPERGGSGSPAPADTAPPSGPAPDTTPQPPVKTFAPDELTVRFGGGEEEAPKRRSLERLQALPSDADPVLIYLKALNDGKTAVFLVGDGVQAIGDGDCLPSPEACEKLRLREGETEFIDVTDDSGAVSAQYQLDLLKIHRSKSASAKQARISSRTRRTLKARVSRARVVRAKVALP